MATSERDGVAQVVVVIDLRDGAPGPADAAAAQDLVEQALRERGLAAADSSRVLIVADAPEVPRRIAEFDRVRSLPGFGPTLHLLVGEPAGDGGGGVSDPWVLKHPALPGRPGGAGVLWAGSTRGVGFRPGRSGVSGRVGRALDPRAADDLVRILRLPRLFDQVLRELAELPAPVACLGVRVVAQDVSDAEIRNALIEAADRLVDTDEARLYGAESPAASGTLAVLSDPAGPDLHTLPSWRLTRGSLHEAYEACTTRIAEAERAVAELRHPRSLLRADQEPARQAAAAAGRALTDYREQLQGALVGIDGSYGLDRNAHKQLKELGVLLPAVPQCSPDEVDTALRREVLGALDRRITLRRIEADLADLAGRTAPVGVAARLEWTAQACPDRLLERLCDPPPLTARHPGPRDLALAAAAAALAGLWFPVGLAAAPVLAGLVIAAAVFGTPRPARSERRPAALAVGAAALVGAGVGALVGAVAHPWALVGAVALAAAAAGAVWQGVRRWTAAVEAWARRIGLDRAAAVAADLDAVLELTVRAWTLADARMHASEEARAIGRVVRRVGDSLPASVAALLAADAAPQPGGSLWDDGDDEAVDPHRFSRGGSRYDSEIDGSPDFVGGAAFPDPARHAPPGQSGPGYPYEDGEEDSGLDGAPGYRAVPTRARLAGTGSTELFDLLLQDLADLVADQVDRYLSRLAANPDADAGLPVEDDLARLLKRLRDHQRHDGIAAAPGFLRRAPNRAPQLRLPGVDQRRILRAISVGDGSDTVRQLCTAEQLCMLNRDAGVSRWVRFAHSSVRDAVRDEAGAAGASVLWLDSGRYAGSLRLTPLVARAAAVARPAAGRNGARR